jgi:1,4-dihydroxy-2-naphthoate polyprenyltransferase
VPELWHAAQCAEDRLIVWLVRAARPSTFILSIAPFVLGALAGMRDASPRWLHILIGLIGIAALHAAANVINDWIDAPVDAIAAQTPGTRITTPGGVLNGSTSIGALRSAGLALLAVGGLCGVVLTLLGVRDVLLLYGFGMALAYSYTAPPLKIAYRGHGTAEIAAIIGYGVLPAAAGYASQTGRGTLDGVLIGVPLGVMAAVLLLIHDYFHADADRQAGKWTPVAAFGEEHAWWLLGVLVAACYASLVGLVLRGMLPLWALGLCLTLIPMAWAWRHIKPPADHERVETAIMFASQVHVLVGIGIAVALRLAASV